MAYIYNGILPQAPKKVKAFRHRPTPPQAPKNTEFSMRKISPIFHFRHFFTRFFLVLVFGKFNLLQKRIEPPDCRSFLCIMPRIEIPLFVAVLKGKRELPLNFLSKNEASEIFTKLCAITTNCERFFLHFKNNFFRAYFFDFSKFGRFFNVYPLNYFFTLFSHILIHTHSRAKIQLQKPKKRPVAESLLSFLLIFHQNSRDISVKIR